MHNSPANFRLVSKNYVYPSRVLSLSCEVVVLIELHKSPSNLEVLPAIYANAIQPNGHSRRLG